MTLKLTNVLNVSHFKNVIHLLFFALIFLLNSLFVNCQTKQIMNNKIILKSRSFQEGGMIPEKFTCQGDDVSPQLSWEAVPDGTKTFALICDDPDAPSGNFVHWVVFNIPADARNLNENLLKQKQLSDNIKQGINDFGSIGYGGPCPPALHRYYFKIYALDIELKSEAGISKADLLKAMGGHIIAQGQLMGKFKKK